jgi:hypothetical protein
MSAARITADGHVTQLDARAGAREVLTEADVQDAAKLTRLLVRLLSDVAGLLRRANPSRIDFEDFPVSTAGAAVQLQHNMRGRVRWWIVGWQSSGTAAPVLKEDTTATDANTLVLLSYVAGTATVRVEAAG